MSIRAKIPVVADACVDIEIPQANRPLELSFGRLSTLNNASVYRCVC